MRRFTVFDTGSAPGATQTVAEGTTDVSTDPTESCLLLLKDSDFVHPDPVKDARASFKRGDVVDVLSPSQHNGDLVKYPIAAPFWLLRVTGVSQAQMQKFRDVWMNGNVIQKKRQFRVNPDTLPAAVQTAISTSRYATISWAGLRANLWDKSVTRAQ